MILTALSSDTSWETLFTASAEDQVTVQTLLISLCAALLLGFVLSASVFAIFVCLVLVVLHLFRFAESREESMQLSVSVPENICFQGLFDDLLDRYCEGYRQKRVKTSDFGTVFEIVFHIRLKKSTNQKEFLDELRQRNGNLPISLVLKENENHFACAEM